MIITLDGPSGSGKSTLAQLLAQRLGFFYINSGYLYRSLAYILVIDYGYDAAQLAVPDVDHVQTILHDDNFIYAYQDGIARIFFKGQEITHHLKSSQVSDHASLISAHFGVRQAIVAMQRKFGALYNLVTDGRDGGTEIYPQAQFKFYVTAQEDIRAQRLCKDLAARGVVINLDDALQMTLVRDMRDTTRLISPLKKADDAIEIDTSFDSIQEILDFMLKVIQK